jgi:hypothetical protein
LIPPVASFDVRWLTTLELDSNGQVVNICPWLPDLAGLDTVTGPSGGSFVGGVVIEATECRR